MSARAFPILLAGIVVVVALAFALRAALAGRATSLRTRSFIVIAAAVVIPALCLSGLGVWAYFRSWNNAANLVSSQSQYGARELNDEIGSLLKIPVPITSAQRARLSRAIVYQFGPQGHSSGALLGDLAAVADPGNHVLPEWAARSLRRKGYAIGNQKQPTAPRDAQIVAWRLGAAQVYYYTDYWGDLQSVSLQPPLRRLALIGAYGVALVALIGLLGAWILSRGVIRPVRRVAEASRRLAEGKGGEPVKPGGPREIRELAQSFNDMNDKLTKAQEAEQAFLLNVSHELKTPLTSIRGYAEGLDDGALPAAEAAAVIGAESNRLERLVGDLLESARLRKSAFTVRREQVDLSAVAYDVVRRYEVTARDAGLALNIRTEPHSLALGDHDRVLQVVSNLVENAIRCTPAPGAVTITTAAGRVTVADTGRGLTSDDLPRAFERFYLYSRYGNERPVGTGLGLAIVKELSEAMGGSVTVSSAPGVGTAFLVELPAAACPAAVSGEAPKPRPAPAGAPVDAPASAEGGAAAPADAPAPAEGHAPRAVLTPAVGSQPAATADDAG